MAALKLLVLAVALVTINALPQDPPPTRNTIFGDERLEGEIFENVDAFNEEIALFNDDDNPYRLPKTTQPIHYNIHWFIDIERLAYAGTVEINLVATQENVNEIVIHSDYHELTSIVLTQGTTVIPQTNTVEALYHFLRIQTATPLAYSANEENQVVYTLTISFGADMREDMYGIYKSWFRNDATDTVRWMAATQFQATAARYAFPCYDEPSFKATFDIIITRPNTHRSWSNTRLNNTVVGSSVGYDDDVFTTTPIMSTYLLAIIVAEYEALEYYENGQLMYEVISRPGALQTGQGQYAFDVGMDLLSNMSDHTAIDYYSTSNNLKMTQASIPDFGAGAMENWGLLTYREAYLLYDEVHTSGYFKQLIAYILSHEIAHMWFGNLVTCDWWNVLWLNEGFARYYQYFLTHWVEPDMGLETRFITEQMHTALLTDSANNPHPLSHSGVGSPAQVSAMFSTLSYNKGAAIIRMTEHLLGHEINREGLRNYLSSRTFNTSLPINLFESLQAAGVAAGALTEYPLWFNVVDFYRSWTEQPGHPVLNVHVNHQTGNMTITQRRFNINTGYSDVNTNWIVPISFATASNPDFTNTKPTHVIRDTVSVINRGTIGDEWIIFNKQQTGYYRVNYDDYTWNIITLALKSEDRTLIHEYNRAQIVNDVFQFARSGLITYTRAFNILSFLEYETEYAPWVAAMTGFSWIRNRLAGSPYLEPFNAMIAQWATRVMSSVTYYQSANDSFMRKYLRYQIAPTMCAMNVRACRIAATAQFNALVQSGIEVAADSRLWVYCNGLREGTEQDFTFLWNRFQNHNVYTEKITLLQTLGCTPYNTTLYTFMDGIVNENYIIRPQDYTTALNSAVTGNEGNTQIIFSYIQANMVPVANAFGSVAGPLSYVSARLRTEDEVDEFQGWAYQNQLALGTAYQNVFAGAESSRQSILWAREVASDLTNYLENGNDEIETTSTTTTTTEAPPSTVAPPVIIEPESPDLSETDSAVTSTISVFLISLAVAVNFV